MKLVRFLQPDCVLNNMKLLVLSCLLALAASSRADGLGAGLVYAPGHASADYYSYPAYAFEYSVNDPHTGDKKAQWEKRDGDVVKGAYSLVEPDGSVRVVEYYADDHTGFNAVVKRLGPNLHPTGPAHVPIYKAPIPVLSSGHHPITIGPVASLGHLADAPLITGPVAGPIHYPAISSASLYKSPIVKSVPLPAPISRPLYIPEPVSHGPIAAPILKSYGHGHDLSLGHDQILAGPILKSGPILHEPILHSAGKLDHGPYLPGPIYKAGPILQEPYPNRPIQHLDHSLLSGPIYKPAPLLREPLVYNPIKSLDYGSILSGPIYKSGALLQEPILQKQQPLNYGPLLSGPLYKPGPILHEPLNWGVNPHHDLH